MFPPQCCFAQNVQFSLFSLQGTVWYSMFKWRVVAQLVSPMGYTASSLGNHEFDDGVSDLVAFLDATDPAFPTVACNLDLSREPELRRRMRGHVVRPVPRADGGRDVLVGIVGYVTPETKDLASTGSVVFLDEVEALRREVGELKRKGVGVIVAVGHSGYRTDLKIAEEVRLKGEKKKFPPHCCCCCFCHQSVAVFTIQ